MTLTDDRLTTIRGLLSKAEATSFPAEAEAFLAKATALMSRYALDEAAVWASAEGGGTPTEKRIELRRPYVSQKALLVNGIAEVFGSKAVRFPGGPGSESEFVSVVGFDSDLEMVETLVTSLLVQATTASVAAQPRGMSPSASAGWRRSFLAGFVHRTVARLEDEHRRVVEEQPDALSGTSMALVLADRGDDVASEFRRRHPHIRVSRVSLGSSRSGQLAGRRAGDRADLGHRRVGGHQGLAAG